jgi:hypothetical protein
MLTTRDIQWLDKFRGAADEAWSSLTTWEKRFCEDVLEKYRVHKELLTLSKKQWEVISNISEKLGL